MSSVKKVDTKEPREKRKKLPDTPDSNASVSNDLSQGTIGAVVREAMLTMYGPPQSQLFGSSPPGTQPNTGQYGPHMMYSQQASDANMSAIMNSLENINRRLSKLDTIENSLSDIQYKVARLESKVSELDTLHKKVDGIEASMNFFSAKFDQWSKDKQDLEGEMKSLQEKISSCPGAVSDLQRDTLQMKEYMIDQRCRSMRDNLIFTEIPETETETVNTERILRTFITEQLKVESDNIHFKRIHRIGTRRQGSNRPRSIIAKFNITEERDRVKRAGRELKGKPQRIFEQFPDEISDYRRDVLMPLQREAWGRGQRANIAVDRLYVNNTLYPVPPPPYRVTPDPHNTRPRLTRPTTG